MKKMKIVFVVIIFIIGSCSSNKNSSTSMSTQEPNFRLKVFSYALTPNKQYIVLEEDDDLTVASKILSSYSTETLINALSIAYLELPPDEQNYVTQSFQNTKSLPYQFREALIVAVKTGNEVNQDPSINALKNLLIVAYDNMTPEEIQSRYYYGSTEYEQKVFQQRWNNFANWYNSQKQQYEVAQSEKNQQQVNSNQSGSGFWGTLGKIVIGVISGYVAYKSSTYNSNIDHQLTMIEMQNNQMQWQINNIQNNLRRLAY